MDSELINKFRDKVNSNGFVLFKYRDIKGKDQWSCICSAMDWITVAMEYIADVKTGKRSYKQSIEMYAYISSIDVVWEAIQQLHRVLFQTDKVPFKNECECFFDKILEHDDNAYFKTIRASFGAHPVNLKGEKEGEKYFASWSGAFLGEDYSVLLYSNIVGNGFRTLYLRIKELNKFLDTRYNYLNQLMDEIDRQYEEFKIGMKNTPIKRVDDICNQLSILKEESTNRLHLYSTFIEQFNMIFNVQITNKKNEKMVSEYKESLKPLMSQLYKSLQNMDNNEMDYDILYQTSEKLPNGYGYLVSKLTDYIYGVGYHPTMWEDRLRESFKEHFIMEYSSYDELYVLIVSCINKLNQNEGLAYKNKNN